MSMLLDYLEHSAMLFPDKTAFADENESVTFAQLKELGQSVGSAISKHVKDIRLPIAVLTNHSVADVVAFMGALYAGCFYIPLDGNTPKEYISRRLESINPAKIIDAKTLSELPRDRHDTAELTAIRQRIISTDPAYAIFTSGSTGVPKAALVSHGSVLNLAEWFKETFDFSEKTVFAGQAPFYFDASVKEIYSTLKNGCTLYLFPKKIFISPLKVMRRVNELGVNVLPWAAAAIKMTANSGVFDQYIPSGIEDVIFGGENMPARVLNIWRQAMPETRFTNVYGPSETTVDCLYYTADRELPDGESVPIGRPCRDMEILLLDQDKKLVADGEPGEIYVRGVCVGLGYYGNPERTSEVFIQNPLNPLYRDIVYRTGDIARKNEYGELVFLSRIDYQVKHMGSRIELGEIETAAEIDGVKLVCCDYDKEGSKILMFYEGSAPEQELAAGLRASLPKYMQPKVIIKVDEMPVRPNGKIDRTKVRELYYDN